MPTILTRTFALLNNIKPPTIEEDSTSSHILDISNIQKYTSTPDISIWKAAEQGNLAALLYYVQNSSVDPTTLLNTRDPDTDCTLLHLVVSNSAIDTLPILKLLLNNGADATARNVYNVQAIHMVSLHCPHPLEPIKLLLNHKVSPNARDGDGWTPLHYAARFCQPPDEILKLLISRGADVNLTDAGHKSPLFGLLANGDLTTALDYLIHTAKADVSIRGDFLDQASRKTKPGTIILQAAKYGRIDCLSMLIQSTVAMNQFRRVIDRDELDHANYLVKDQQSRLRKSDGTDTHIQKLDLILSLLQELEDTLERDPLSLLNIRKLNVTSTMTIEPSKDGQKIQRRHTLMVMIDSMRKKKSSNTGQNAPTVQRKTSNTSKLLRKMSRIIRRTKSENNTATSNATVINNINENKSTGPSR
ncbi:ankyrin repeat-containing domain protein [Mucor mucedo]|uniref:ankyrin repeat-containing domain protein n=1 Tax=Mucor mucedo TaxID=29922 RepID=UPI00221ECBF5|nr:ankyrin repeat-containing domain protein [Mucor mucedo]KAI7877322.1 ankyrin repeat-containing domain protein [Mucor mucedo]